MESDGLGLHLTLLDVHLVTAQDNGDVLADTDKVTYSRMSALSIQKKTPDYTPSDGEPRKKLTVPVGNVLVGDTGGNIEHDDTTLAVDVVSIAQTTELLLTSSVPDVELDRTQVL